MEPQLHCCNYCTHVLERREMADAADKFKEAIDKYPIAPAFPKPPLYEVLVSELLMELIERVEALEKVPHDQP